MTTTKKVALLLASGRAQDADQIARQANVTRVQASRALRNLCEIGCATLKGRAQAAVYTITAKGQEFAAQVPTKPPAKLLRDRENARAHRAARKLLEQMSPNPVRIVESAKATRHPLQSVWSAAWFADREAA